MSATSAKLQPSPQSVHQALCDALRPAQQVVERPQHHEGAVFAGEARMELPQQLRRRQGPVAVRLLRGCAGPSSQSLIMTRGTVGRMQERGRGS